MRQTAARLEPLLEGTDRISAHVEEGDVGLEKGGVRISLKLDLIGPGTKVKLSLRPDLRIQTRLML